MYVDLHTPNVESGRNSLALELRHGDLFSNALINRLETERMMARHGPPSVTKRYASSQEAAMETFPVRRGGYMGRMNVGRTSYTYRAIYRRTFFRGLGGRFCGGRFLDTRCMWRTILQEDVSLTRG